MNMVFEMLDHLSLLKDTSDSSYGNRHENDYLHSILNSLSEGIIVADHKGKFQYFNNAAKEILGLGSMDISINDWTSVYGCYYPDAVTPYPSDKLPLARAIRDESVSEEIIFIRNQVRPEGIYISISANPVKNIHGKIIGGTVIFGDVTELKNNERELEKLSNAVEQTADSVVITDKNGTIEYINPAFEKTTGYSQNDILGENMSVLKSGLHDKKFYKDLWKTISSGNSYNGLIINRKKEGELYWSEQTITPMIDARGQINHYVSVLRDITQARKQQEQEVQIRLARQVQSQFYKTDISIKGLDISGSSIPAAETNGDYYDVLKINESTYSIIVGDVVGHGISSALIMAQTRAYLRAFTKHESDPGVLLTWLNQELVKDLDETHFVTLVLVRIDLECHSMVYASAGHISGYLFNSFGETKYTLESTGIPLGFMPDYQYENSPTINLQPEDFFILLTDGIVESHDDNQNEFGLERALEVVKENHNLPISKIQKSLHDAVLTFSSDLGQEDDITSVICKFQPGDEEIIYSSKQ